MKDISWKTNSQRFDTWKMILIAIPYYHTTEAQNCSKILFLKFTHYITDPMKKGSGINNLDLSWDIYL